MTEKISERYQKALVTVAMGFRTEDDIRKNGLHRFIKDEQSSLLEYVTSLFNEKGNVLVLRVKQSGYRSEHMSISSKTDLDNFVKNIVYIYDKDNEVWVVSSSSIECWRGRIYLSNNNFNDTIEMAYSCDDHILDHIDSSLKAPYVCYKKEGNNFKVSNTNLDNNTLQITDATLKDILYRYSDKFCEIKEDLGFIGIDGISLDVRVNNGYDFHDFDVSYENIKKVIDYYLPQLDSVKKYK